MNSVPFTDTHPDAATLSAYHDGELRGFARAEVEAHLSGCPRCRRALNEIAALDDALRSLPPLDPPGELHEAVLARAAGSRPRPRRRLAWGVAALVAALAAILGGYDLLAQPLAPSASPAALRSTPHAPAAAKKAVPQAAAPSFAPGTGSSAASPRAAQPPGASYQAQGYTPPAAQGAAPKHGALQSQGATGNTVIPTLAGRLIARTGEVDLRVRDVQKTFSAVTGIATRQHGYVSDSNNNALGATNGSYAATLTLRVPAVNFQATLDALKALTHTALTVQSSSQDITDNYHNLQAQLQAYQATRTQLTALMRQARTVHDALTVLNQLTQVNANIDSVQGQIMASANSVMLATVTVNLSSQPKQQVVIAPVRRWQPGRDLLNALGNLQHAAEAIASVAIYAAVYLALPALLVALALLLRRRRWAPRRA